MPSFNTLHELNLTLAHAHTQVSWRQGVKIRIQAGERTELVTRNQLVQWAEKLPKENRDIREFNRLFTHLDQRANTRLQKKSWIVRLITKIQQLWGNRTYKRKDHLPKEMAEPPAPVLVNVPAPVPDFSAPPVPAPVSSEEPPESLESSTEEPESMEELPLPQEETLVPSEEPEETVLEREIALIPESENKPTTVSTGDSFFYRVPAQVFQSVTHNAQAAGSAIGASGKAILEYLQPYNPASVLSYVGNALWAGGQKAAEGANAAKAYRKQLLEGIDFYPIFVGGYLKGKQASEALIAYWNAPGMEYDPFTANLMQGFAGHFGKRLDTLLVNAVRLNLPQFAGTIAEKLKIASKAGITVAEGLYAFGNPLGWVDTAIMISNLGVNVSKGFKTGVLGKLNKSIDDYIASLAQKRNLNPEYMHYLTLENLQMRAWRTFKNEEEAYIQTLTDRGLKPESPQADGWITYIKDSVTQFITPPWYKQYLKDAPESYRKAEEAYRNLKIACDRLYNQNRKAFDNMEIIGRKTLEYMALLDMEIILKNSASKTMHHLADDLCTVIPDQKAAALMRTMILGSTAKPLEAAALIVKPVSGVRSAALAIKNAFTKPLNTFLPQAVHNAAGAITAPASRFIGAHLGDATIGNLTEAAIGTWGLENVKLFNSPALQLQLRKQVQKTALEPVIDIAGRFLSLDDELAKLLQKAGSIMADLLAEQLAAALRMQLSEKNQAIYSAERLMSEKVEVSAFRKGAALVGNWMQSGGQYLHSFYQDISQPFPVDFEIQEEDLMGS